MSPESLELWKSAFEISGVVLLLLTFFAGAGVVWFSRKANELQAKQLKQFDDRLTDAKTELGKQQERAANAEAKIALAEQHAAEANEKAESEKLERAKLEASVAWRRLTDKQKTNIGSSLKTFFNQGVSFWSNAGDVEAQSFTADIAEAVTRTGTLRVYSPAQVLKMMEGGSANLGKPIKRIETGVVVVYTEDTPSQKLADAIAELLTGLGFDAISRKNEPPKEPLAAQVWVNVEPRPFGPQGEYKLSAQLAARKKQ